MKYSLRYAMGVYEDLSSAFQWYETIQPNLGEKFIGQVELILNKLEKHPIIFGYLKAPLRKANIHHFPYVILFEVFDDTVIIYAVFHTSREPLH